MGKVLLVLFLLVAILNPALAGNSAIVDAYGSISASYYNSVTEFWITEQGTTTTTTYAVTGTINGMGAHNQTNGMGVISGDLKKTGAGTTTTSSYSVDLHGVKMESGTKLRSVAGVSTSSSGPAASASGKVELNQQAVSGYQRVDYTAGFAPGSYGVQSYSASQSTTVQANSGNGGK